MNERILMSALSSRKDLYKDYKIGPEDLLEISVFEEEKLNKTVRVSSQGNVSLPLLGVLRVKGLTANDLEKEIRDLLAEKYLQDPHVSVFIKEYRSQRISVMGAVDKPGVFEVSGQKTVLDMLAMAGGLSSGGGKPDAGSLLFLVRPPRLEEEVSKEERETEAEQEPEEQTPRTFVIDLEELLVKGDLTLNRSSHARRHHQRPGLGQDLCGRRGEEARRLLHGEEGHRQSGDRPGRRVKNGSGWESKARSFVSRVKARKRRSFPLISMPLKKARLKMFFSRRTISSSSRRTG